MSVPATQYYGLRVGPGERGYDGLLRLRFGTDPNGAWVEYLTTTGWVDSAESVVDLGDWGTERLTESAAQTLARDVFGATL